MKAALALVLAIGCLGVVYAVDGATDGSVAAGRLTPEVTRAICDHNKGCVPCDMNEMLHVVRQNDDVTVAVDVNGRRREGLSWTEVRRPWPAVTTEFERDGVRYVTGTCAYTITNEAAGQNEMSPVTSVVKIVNAAPLTFADAPPQVNVEIGASVRACGENFNIQLQKLSSGWASYMTEEMNSVSYRLPSSGACVSFTVTAPVDQLSTLYYGLDLRTYYYTQEASKTQNNNRRGVYHRTYSEWVVLALVGFAVGALAGAVYGCRKWRAARMVSNKVASYKTVETIEAAECKTEEKTTEEKEAEATAPSVPAVLLVAVVETFARG